MSRHREPGDPGVSAVHAVHRDWQVDDEWCVWNARGFAWWGHRLRQRVWAEPAFEDEGFSVQRVCAVTDWLTGAKETGQMHAGFAFLSRLASTGALVVEDGEGRVSLFSSMYVHPEVAAWVPHYFGQAAIVQPIEAERAAEAAAELLGCQPAWSNHPASGARPAPDEMLGVVDMVYRPMGQGLNGWADPEGLAAVARELNAAGYFANAGGGGLTAEFPFGRSRTSMLQVLTDGEHPLLGSGVMLQLHLPLDQELDEAVRLAITLNRLEAHGRFKTPTLGSWTVDGIETAPHVVFVTFLPSALHMTDMLSNLVMYSARRAAGAARLLGDGEPGKVIDIVAARWNGFVTWAGGS